MDITFVKSEKVLSGKRATAVATMIDRMAEEGVGEPVPFEELVEGLQHPHQYTPALLALELAGVVSRWEYAERGSRGTKTAYSLENVEVVV